MALGAPPFPAELLVIVELGLYSLAGWTLFRGWGATLAESAAYALMAVLMWLSFLFQLAFLIEVPWLAILAEAAGAVFCLFVLVRNRPLIRSLGRSLKYFILEFPVPAAILILLWTCLAVQALFLPPGTGHWDELVRVLLIEGRGSMFPGAAQQSAALIESPCYPVNHLILSHLILRWGTDLGISLTGFMAYMVIGLATYALARRFSWPPTAITVTMVTVSLPRLVFLSLTPSQEIVAAAAAVFCLLAAFRLVEQPNAPEFLWLILGLLFSVSGNSLGFVFPAVLAALIFVILFRRHGVRIWGRFLIRRPWMSILALLPAFFFSQAWLYAHNLSRQGYWMGPPGAEDFVKNSDGIQGALANLVRYFFESINFTRPVDLICQWAAHFSPVNMLNGVYNALFAPLFGNLGAVQPFALTWSPNEALVWFGPFGFLLILPAFLYSFLRGNRRLKAIVTGLAAYFYLVTLIAAWAPGNVRFFTVVFACGSFTAAYFLPPWRFSQSGQRWLQIFCVLLILDALACQTLPVAVGGQTPARVDSDRVKEYAAQATAGARVSVVTENPGLLYPYILARPDLKYEFPDQPRESAASIKLSNPEVLLIIYPE